MLESSSYIVGSRNLLPYILLLSPLCSYEDEHEMFVYFFAILVTPYFVANVLYFYSFHMSFSFRSFIAWHVLFTHNLFFEKVLAHFLLELGLSVFIVLCVS